MKEKFLKYIPFLILIVVISLSIAYSAFKHELLIEDTIADVRIQKDIRVTDFNLYNFTNNATSSYEEYNHNAILTNINLPNQGSTITYKVEVTNFGNVKMGIYELTNLPNNLTYEIKDYTLKNKICNSNNKCTLGAVKEFYLTIKYKENGYDSNNTKYNLNLGIDFQQIYTITYEGITNNNYPTEVIEKDTINITFPESIKKVQVYENETRLSNPNDYTYEKNNLVIPNVDGNIKIEYKEKVYLTLLATGAYYKEANYINTITSVSFVDYIDTSKAVKTYNLEENNGTNIIGWLEENETGHDLYIGSYWDIYTRTLQNAFKDMSSVTSISFNNLNTSENTSCYYTFYNMSSVTTLDLSNFNTSNVTSMAHMFHGMNSLTTLDLKTFNTSKVTVMYQMFQNLSALTYLNISSFDTSNVTKMYAMFSGVSSLTKLNLSHFNTSKTTDIGEMFHGMNSLTELDVTKFDTSKVTNMYYTFTGLKSLTELDVSSFDTSQVKNMGHMFEGMYSLTELDVSKFDTNQATQMHYMFSGMTSLTELDVSSFDTTNVTRMEYMFYNLQNIKELDVSKFITNNVNNMSYMFYNLNKVSSLDVSNFKTTNVTNMAFMFWNMISLTELDVSNFDTSKLTNMTYMFCRLKVTNLDLSKWDTSLVTNTAFAFTDCDYLEQLDLRNADFSSVTYAEHMFFGVLNTIKIIVKDDTQKVWIKNCLGDGVGNVVTFSEL